MTRQPVDTGNSGSIKFKIDSCPDFIVAIISQTCTRFCFASEDQGEKFSFSDGEFKMSLACGEHLIEILDVAFKTPSENSFVKKLTEGALMPIIQALGSQLFMAREGCFFGAGAPVSYNSRKTSWERHFAIKSTKVPVRKPPACKPDSDDEDDYISDDDQPQPVKSSSRSPSPTRSPMASSKGKSKRAFLEKCREQHWCATCSGCGERNKDCECELKIGKCRDHKTQLPCQKCCAASACHTECFSKHLEEADLLDKKAGLKK